MVVSCVFFLSLLSCYYFATVVRWDDPVCFHVCAEHRAQPRTNQQKYPFFWIMCIFIVRWVTASINWSIWCGKPIPWLLIANGQRIRRKRKTTMRWTQRRQNNAFEKRKQTMVERKILSNYWIAATVKYSVLRIVYEFGFQLYIILASRLEYNMAIMHRHGFESKGNALRSWNGGCVAM